MLLLIVLWAILTVALGLLGGWAPGLVSDIPDAILFYCWLGVGAVLAIITWLGLRKGEHRLSERLSRKTAIIFVGLAIPLGYWLLPSLNRQGDNLHYRMHRKTYQAIADSLTATSPRRAELSDASVGAFLVDTGPPLRVAFVRSSFLNDWEGIIFDPSDSLLTWEQHAPHRAVPLFNRAVIGCSRREPKWFDCGTLPPLPK